MKKIFLALVIILGLFLIAGIYKFNFTNDTIFAQDYHGNSIPIHEEKNADENTKIKELKTKTGKMITITESHPVGQSIATVTIITKGFKVNRFVELSDIDPIEKIELMDLDNNGFEELYLFSRNAGTSSEGNFYTYISYRDEVLVTCKKEKINADEYLKGGALEGYMGHNKFSFDKERQMIVMEFPIYRENDTNNNPTGGTKKIYYTLDHNHLKLTTETK